MKLKFFIKLGISLALLGLVLNFTDLGTLKATITQIPISYALLIVLLYGLGQCISAYRWHIIVRAAEIETTYLGTLKSYFIGMFVNCFGLGVLGGDLARGILVAEGQAMKAEAITSVVADRLQGLGVLALMGAFGGFACLLAGTYTQHFSLPWILFACGASITIGWYTGPFLIRSILPREGKLYKKIESILHVFPKDLPTVLRLLSISVFFHALQLSLTWLMARAINVDIPFEYLIVAVPLINIVSTLPISWNGLGVRENAYVFFLASGHGILTPQDAVAFGTMWLLAVTVNSAIGGIVAFLTKDFRVLYDKSKVDSAEAIAVSS